MESVCWGNSTVGSNPTLSAIFSFVILGAVPLEKTMLTDSIGIESFIQGTQAGTLRPICNTGTGQIVREMESFCQVEGAAAGGLKNLLTATEAVRDDKCVQRRLTHGWQQHAFTGGLRHRVFITFEAKRPGHTTASRVKRLQFGAHFKNERFGVCHFHERFLMAVAM